MSNELSFSRPTRASSETNMMQSVAERATAEVQAQYVIAKKFPRDEIESEQKIKNACKRSGLAEQAMYAYPRGNQRITGPSIRLAEAMAQYWGNIDCGVREISQSNGVSVAEAYAVDLETNTRITKVFHVTHERYTKNGVTKLKDPRDIYELVANQGSRRMRACILAIIPGDVIDGAVNQCRITLETSDVPISERIKNLVAKFDEQGVKVDHIEKRLGHNLDAIIPSQIVELGGIYKSIKDGMAKREDFFDIKSKVSSDAKKELDKILDG